MIKSGGHNSVNKANSIFRSTSYFQSSPDKDCDKDYLLSSKMPQEVNNVLWGEESVVDVYVDDIEVPQVHLDEIVADDNHEVSEAY